MTPTTAESGADRVARATTLLFVPGDRPERFAKASASGADIVIIDLEDAVVPVRKRGALASAVDALQPGSPLSAVVRLNPIGSPSFDSEFGQLLDLTRRAGHGLAGVMIAKADSATAIRDVGEQLPLGMALLPLIESARGVVECGTLAGVGRVTRLAFGAVDFALDVGCSTHDRVLDGVRSELVLRSRAAGIAAPVDSPSTDIDDDDAIFASAGLAKDFGFTGKLCIHPRQIEIVARAFAPTSQEVAWAHSVIEADRAAGGAAAALGGMMIDTPVVARALRILEMIG